MVGVCFIFFIKSTVRNVLTALTSYRVGSGRNLRRNGFDPVDEVGHFGVDTGVSSNGTSVTPGHDTDQSEGVLSEEGAARVTLARVNSTYRPKKNSYFFNYQKVDVGIHGAG